VATTKATPPVARSERSRSQGPVVIVAPVA
jgi:hypothetical protein